VYVPMMGMLDLLTPNPAVEFVGGIARYVPLQVR